MSRAGPPVGHSLLARTAVVVMAAITAACSSGRDAGIAMDPLTEQTVVVRAPTEQADSPPELSNTAAADVARRQRRYQYVEPLGALQERLGAAPVLLEPGAHSTNALGLDLELHLETWWRLDYEGPGRLDLSPATNAFEITTPGISIVRLTGWLGPWRLRSTRMTAVGRQHDFEARDVDTWLEENWALEVIDSGGLAGTSGRVRWWDLEMLDGGHTDCAPVDQRCLPLTFGGGPVTVLSDTGRHRLYMTEDNHVAALARVGEAQGDLSALDGIVERLTIGAIGPPPHAPDCVTASHAQPDRSGSWNIAAIAGVRIDAPPSTEFGQRPGRLDFVANRMLGNNNASVERLVSTSDGRPVDDVADALEALRADPALDVTPLSTSDALEVDGYPAVAFAVEGGPSSALLHQHIAPDDNQLFGAVIRKPSVHLWLVASPIGPIAITVQRRGPVGIEESIGTIERTATMISFVTSTESCYRLR